MVREELTKWKSRELTETQALHAHTERKPVKPDQSNWNDLTNIQLHVLLIIEMSKTVQ